MKKSIFTALAVWILTSMLSMPVYAGDINSDEQRIISAISATYEYEGAYYRVTDDYIKKVSDYLNRDDVNFTSAEVDSYLDIFYANFASGIAEGYMVCVGKVETEKPKPNPPASEENQDDNSDDANNNTQAGSGNAGKNDQNNNESNSEPVSTETTQTTEASIGESVTGEANSEAESTTETGSGEDISDRMTETIVLEDVIVIPSSTTKNTTVEESTEDVVKKDYSDAEPYQQGISVGTIAIFVVVVVAVAMAGVLLWHRNKRYRR